MLEKGECGIYRPEGATVTATPIACWLSSGGRQCTGTTCPRSCRPDAGMDMGDKGNFIRCAILLNCGSCSCFMFLHVNRLTRSEPTLDLSLFEHSRDVQACEESDLAMARYDVNVHVAIGSHPFASSKLVSFAPAVVLCNASNAIMHVQQHHSSKLLTLKPGHSRPLIWFNPDAKPELLVQPVCEGVQWSWSGRFTVSEVSSHALRIHSKNDPSPFTILPVTVSMQVCSDCMCISVLPDL